MLKQWVHPTGNNTVIKSGNYKERIIVTIQARHIDFIKQEATIYSSKAVLLGLKTPEKGCKSLSKSFKSTHLIQYIVVLPVMILQVGSE